MGVLDQRVQPSGSEKSDVNSSAELDKLLASFSWAKSIDQLVLEKVDGVVQESDVESWHPLDWSMAEGRGWYLEIDGSKDSAPDVITNGGNKAVIVLLKQPDDSTIVQLGSRKVVSGAFLPIKEIADPLVEEWFEGVEGEKLKIAEDLAEERKELPAKALELIQATELAEWKAMVCGSGTQKLTAILGGMQFILHYYPKEQMGKDGHGYQHMLQVVDTGENYFYWEDTAKVAKEAWKAVLDKDTRQVWLASQAELRVKQGCQVPAFNYDLD